VCWNTVLRLDFFEIMRWFTRVNRQGHVHQQLPAWNLGTPAMFLFCLASIIIIFFVKVWCLLLLISPRRAFTQSMTALPTPTRKRPVRRP